MSTTTSWENTSFTAADRQDDGVNECSFLRTTNRQFPEVRINTMLLSVTVLFENHYSPQQDWQQ